MKCLSVLQKKTREFKNIVKIGRTHMQDATPLTLGDEFSGYKEQIKNDLENIEKTFKKMYALAQGGTAVGTGINAPKNFEKKFINHLKKITKILFILQITNLNHCHFMDQLLIRLQL